MSQAMTHVQERSAAEESALRSMVDRTEAADATRRRERWASEVRGAYGRWVEAISGGDPAKVVELYAEDAVLLATFAAAPKNKTEQLHEYFTHLMSLPGLRARTEQSILRIYDNLACHDGLYSFAYEKDGEEVVVPARFSFVYRKQATDWVIVAHHSSQLPAATN